MRFPHFTVPMVLLSILCGCGGNSANPKIAHPPTLMGVAVGPTGQSVNLSASVQLTATASYSDGTSADVTSTARWSSSDASTANVGTGQRNPGMVVGVASGSVTISAAFGGQTGSTTVTVGSAKLTSVAINPTNPTIAVGAKENFTAKGSYSDGTTGDVTFTANWTSSDPAVATIQAGTAVGVANGSSNIQASLAGATALTILNVSTSGGTQVGLNLSEINPSIAPGATLTIIAEAVFDNNSKQNVTDSATWKSSDPATVSVAAGVVTGVAVTASPVIITAISGGFTNTATVTVASNAQPIPLMDMTTQNYLGFQGGLYENGSDTVPSIHDKAGLAAAAAIQPLDQNGNPSASGAVVFLGIGMSNATIEYSAFKTTAEASSSVNHTTLAMEDGAYGSVTACPWTVAQGPASAVCTNVSGVPAQNQYDRVRDTVLATDTQAPSAPAGCGTTSVPCLTEAQVQVIWLKDANPSPASNGLGSLTSTTVCANDLTANPLPEACNYEVQLGKIIRAAKSRYPNLRQVFLATRIYAGYASVPLNPEPYAYEYGFSAKWLIQAQIDQELNPGTIDPVAGDLSITSGIAAWTAWGPYLWADGTKPRSDGLTWVESDFQSDGTHPNAQGTTKIVNLLMGFFGKSTYTPWFRP